jgi:hypothetical protein
MCYDVREDLRHMIDHMANRIHYTESRIGAFAVLGTAIFAAGVAVFSFAIGDTIKTEAIRHASIALSLGLVLTGLISLVVYARQTNYKYPFTDVTKTWKWFYRNALSDSKKFSLSFLDYIYRTEESTNDGKNAYNIQYAEFENTIKPKLMDESEHTKQDFQQIFVLHVNECYKNVFLTNIRRVINYGLILSIVISLSTFAILFLNNKDCLVTSGSSLSHGKDFDVSVIWNSNNTRKYSTGEEETKVHFLIEVKGKSQSTKQLNSLSLLAKANKPIYITEIYPPIKIVGPTTFIINKDIWIKTELLSDLKDVRVYE